MPPGQPEGGLLSWGLSSWQLRLSITSGQYAFPESKPLFIKKKYNPAFSELLHFDPWVFNLDFKVLKDRNFILQIKMCLKAHINFLFIYLYVCMCVSLCTWSAIMCMLK